MGETKSSTNTKDREELAREIQRRKKHPVKVTKPASPTVSK